MHPYLGNSGALVVEGWVMEGAHGGEHQDDGSPGIDEGQLPQSQAPTPPVGSAGRRGIGVHCADEP